MLTTVQDPRDIRRDNLRLCSRRREIQQPSPQHPQRSQSSPRLSIIQDPKAISDIASVPNGKLLLE